MRAGWRSCVTTGALRVRVHQSVEVFEVVDGYDSFMMSMDVSKL